MLVIEDIRAKMLDIFLYYTKVVIPTQSQWRIQDFPEGGVNPKDVCTKPIIWQVFRRKLHENERN